MTSWVLPVWAMGCVVGACWAFGFLADAWVMRRPSPRKTLLRFGKHLLWALLWIPVVVFFSVTATARYVWRDEW